MVSSDWDIDPEGDRLPRLESYAMAGRICVMSTRNETANQPIDMPRHASQPTYFLPGTGRQPYCFKRGCRRGFAKTRKPRSSFRSSDSAVRTKVSHHLPVYEPHESEAFREGDYATCSCTDSYSSSTVGQKCQILAGECCLLVCSLAIVLPGELIAGYNCLYLMLVCCQDFSPRLYFGRKILKPSWTRLGEMQAHYYQLQAFASPDLHGSLLSSRSGGLIRGHWSAALWN